MVTSFALVRRRADISEERFIGHWRDVHGPLVLEIDYLRGYLQYRRAGRPLGCGLRPAALDGIAAFWWDDLNSARDCLRDPSYTQHAQPDEANFLDVSQLVPLHAEPVRLAGGAVAGEGAAALLLLAFAEPVREAELRVRCANLAAEIDDCLLHRVLAEEDGSHPPFDAVLECRWANPAHRDSWAESARARIDDVGLDRERSSAFSAELLEAVIERPE